VSFFGSLPTNANIESELFCALLERFCLNIHAESPVQVPCRVQIPAIQSSIPIFNLKSAIFNPLSWTRKRHKTRQLIAWQNLQQLDASRLSVF